MANVSLSAGYSGYPGLTIASTMAENGPGQQGQVFSPLRYETTGSVPDLWIPQKGVYGGGYGLQNGTPRAPYQ